MSFQNFVTQRLSALTASINAISTNAKKIDELPVQQVLNSASKIHVSRNGISESLEIQKILASVTSGNYDKLLSIGDIVLNDNVVTIPANTQWVISQFYYTNIANIAITIPYAVFGFSRKDILVANKFNGITLIKGVETTGITIRPNIPIDTILVTELDVSNTVVGNPTVPVIGDSFVSKTERYKIIIPNNVSYSTLNDERHFIEFTNQNQSDFECFVLGSGYVGGQNHPLRIRNNTGVDFKLINLSNSVGNPLGSALFFFNNSEDFLLKDKDIVEFVFNADLQRFEYFGIINDPTKEDKENKGVANGYAPLDENSKIADSYFYSKTKGQVTATNSVSGDVFLDYDLNEVISSGFKYVVLPVTTKIGKEIYVFAENNSSYFTLKANQIGSSRLSGGVNGISGAVASLAIYPKETYRFVYRENGYWYYNKVQEVDVSNKVDKDGAKVLSDQNYTLAEKNAVALIVNKEDAANKSNSWLDYLSTTKFPTWNAIVTYIVDLFSVNKVIEISANTILSDSYSGKLIVVTANCSITVPDYLKSGFNVSVVTLPGITVGFTLGSLVEFINNVGFSMAGGKSCTLQGRSALNKFLIFGAL